MTRGSTPNISGRKTVLERDSAIPLYYQLAKRLEGELITLDLKPGDRFFTDRELVSRFSVSLLTARQAVDQLLEKQLLVRRQGSGTYVTALITSLSKSQAGDAVLFAGWDLSRLSTWDAMYFKGVFDGIREEAEARNITIVFDDPHWRDVDQLVKEVQKRRLKGALVMVGDHHRERAALFATAGLGIVSINDQIPNTPCVRPDDYGGAMQGVAYLLDLGHRHFIHLNSGESTPHWMDVRKGYEDGITRAGLKLSENPVFIAKAGIGSVDAGAEAMQAAIDAGLTATAVFGGNDLMAIGAIHQLKKCGLEVPGHISVLGFDGIEAGELCVPTVSSMLVDRRELGRRALAALLDGSAHIKPIPVTLLRRASAQAPAESGLPIAG